MDYEDCLIKAKKLQGAIRKLYEALVISIFLHTEKLKGYCKRCFLIYGFSDKHESYASPVCITSGKSQSNSVSQNKWPLTLNLIIKTIMENNHRGNPKRI